MLSEHDIWGELGQCDEPDWQPLLDIIGVDLVGWFMWMSEIELDDDTRVHAYKHRCTRRYFHLAVDGRAYVYVPRYRYREIDRRQAIDIAFECWKELCPEEEHDAIRAALRRARRAETRRGEMDSRTARPVALSRRMPLVRSVLAMPPGRPRP